MHVAETSRLYKLFDAGQHVLLMLNVLFHNTE